MAWSAVVHMRCVSNCPHALRKFTLPLESWHTFLYQSPTSHIRLHSTTIVAVMAAVADHLGAPSPGVFQRATEAAEFIRSKLPEELHRPRVAVVCGSGLGGIANTVREDVKHTIDYKDIPHFPKTTVQGHAGQLLFAYMGEAGVPVVLLLGRAQSVNS